MEEFYTIFEMIFFNLGELVRTIDSYQIAPGVSYFDIVIGFLIFGFVVTMFWKGAKA